MTSTSSRSGKNTVAESAGRGPAVQEQAFDSLSGLPYGKDHERAKRKAASSSPENLIYFRPLSSENSPVIILAKVAESALRAESRGQTTLTLGLIKTNLISSRETGSADAAQIISRLTSLEDLAGKIGVSDLFNEVIGLATRRAA